MNPFSKRDFKQQARKIAHDPEKAGPGWTLAGLVVVLAVVVTLVRSCQP